MRKHRRSREAYARGLPDHHDPTAGIGGAPPALSALTLRLWLAGLGLVFSASGAAIAAWAGLATLAAVLAVLATIAVVDLAWAPQAPR